MVVTFSSLNTDRRKLPEAGGGFADVYQGQYNGCKAAVKLMRLYTSSNRELFLSVCITSRTVYREPALNLSLVEVLPGGHCVETPAASKCFTVARHNAGLARFEFCIGFKMDEKWQYQRIY